MTQQSFSSKEVCDATGVSYRQLDYWTRTSLVRPSIALGHGSGCRRRWSAFDLIQVDLIKTMLDSGIHLQLIRDSMQTMGLALRGRLLNGTYHDAYLIVEPSQQVARLDEDPIFVNCPSWVFPLSQIFIRRINSCDAQEEAPSQAGPDLSTT